MPTQNDFNRITLHIIQPVRKLYGGEINDYAIEAMVEDLSGYSDEVLQSGMKILRKSCKRNPSIAHIVESCEEAAKIKSAPIYAAPIKAHEQTQSTSTAEQVMKSPFGQKALREGWANDVWVITMRSGKTDYTDADAERFRLSMQQAIKDAAMLDKAKEHMEPKDRAKLGILMDTAMANALWKLWVAFQQKEQTLRNKYLLALPVPRNYHQPYAD